MSLDEKLFYHLWKYRKGMSKKDLPDTAATFDQLEGRLSVLSSLLAKKTTKVKRGKQLGGLVGDSLFFPPNIYLSDDKLLNELAYLHHACFAVTARALGFSLKYDSVTAFSRLLASIVAAPTVLKRMQEDFPRLAEESQQIYQLYLLEDSPYKVSSRDLLGSRVQQLSLDVVRGVVAGAFSKNTIISKAQCGLLSPDEVLRLSHELEAEFAKAKIKTSLPLPPFFSLLPLDGLLQFHKDEGVLGEDTRDSSPETTLESDPKDIVKRVELNEDENYNPASILMEAVQTIDLFDGGLKRVDGSDELDEHQENLDDLDVKEVVRTNKETKSIFQADIAYEIVSDESNQKLEDVQPDCFFYPEWNYKKTEYLKNWCQLYEAPPKTVGKESEAKEYCERVSREHARQIRNLRHRVEQITLSRRWKNRQRSGEDIDIDSVIDGLASIKSGHSPDERFYMSKPKKNKDVSILILLDASLSSDSWVEGRQVLDISKESVVIIQQALSNIFENIALMAFNGQTRQKCEYYNVQEFNETWKSSIAKLMAVQPSGYTRIGTALRHSLFKINKTKSEKKVIVLISDGKPTDYDAYEGQYGIEDIKQVVREAKQKDVHIMSLAIDRQAKYYFPKMFGKNNFRVIKDPSFLADHFMDLFSRLI